MRVSKFQTEARRPIYNGSSQPSLSPRAQIYKMFSFTTDLTWILWRLKPTEMYFLSSQASSDHSQVWIPADAQGRRENVRRDLPPLWSE